MEINNINVNGYTYSYKLIRKQVKNINMRISDKGEIIVSANKYVPVSKIEDFLISKINWILEKQETVRNQVNISKPNYNKRSIYLFGLKLKIKVISSKFNKVSYDRECLYVQLKEGSELEKVIDKFLRKLCKDVFEDISQIYYKRLSNDYSLEYPVIKVRSMTSRWGSCMVNKKVITLNSKLIHYNPEFIEYVVLHEYAHFIQPNHSKQFYYIIEKYMPNYKVVIENSLT